MLSCMEEGVGSALLTSLSLKCQPSRPPNPQVEVGGRGVGALLLSGFISLLRRRSLGSSRIPSPCKGGMRDEPKERLRRRLGIY